MLSGFNVWQRRVTLLGIAGALVIIIGLFGPLYPLVITGLALALSCILILILLGNRQNWRQLKNLRQELAHGRKGPKERSDTVPKASPTSLPRIGASYEHVHRVEARRSDYETFALRSKSTLIRDSFALAATQTEFRFDDLTRLVSAQRLKMLPAVKGASLKHWNRTAFLALARIQTNQRTTETDLENAVKFFQFAAAMFGTKSFRPTDWLLYLESLGELDRFDEQQSVATRYKLSERYPVQAVLLQLNALQSSAGITTQWLQKLNTIYSEKNFSRVEILDKADLKPLDRLRTDAIPIPNGPLVSVIMPTYHGGNLLLSALKSLLAQSWQNLEIIIVDDASDEAYDKYLRQAAALSPKIKLIKQKRNLGAYRARNAGLRVATGDYITVHDDDDWSHGDKIATQVQHLINNPDTPGNMSAHVRTTEELKLLRINNKPILTQLNFSSLMVKRTIFDQVGDWDNVNRGGDSEFRHRVEKYTGKPIVVLDGVPLAFTRTWEGSLTSGEVSRGYVSPERRLYMNAYSQWHDSVGDAVELLKPSGRQKYPIPSSMQPGKRNGDLGDFDVVFMTDFRFPGGTTSLTLAEIKAAADAGYRVGYIHEESPINSSTQPVSDNLFKMQLEGIVEQVGLHDIASIKLLVIRHPSVVQFMDNRATNLIVQKTVLIVNNPPILVGGAGTVFDLSTCLNNVDKLFEKPCLLVAESGVTRELSKGLVGNERLMEITWPGLVSLSTINTPDFSRLPVLGRHSRDHALKWPSTRAKFDAIYTSASYRTTFLGGAASLIEKLGADTVKDKTVHEFGSIEVQEFLNEIDFWAYFHDEQLTESFGMAIAEAMAAGKVVILPSYLETTFGDGALYAAPAEVPNLISEIWDDPSRHKEQSKRAREYAFKNFSTDAFLKRVQTLLHSEHNANNEKIERPD